MGQPLHLFTKQLTYILLNLVVIKPTSVGGVAVSTVHGSIVVRTQGVNLAILNRRNYGRTELPTGTKTNYQREDTYDNHD